MLPVLKIVPVNSLYLHERNDIQRTRRLKRKIAADGVLTNPPIVTPFSGGKKYIVLDGANRVTAVSLLSLPHIIVQIVDYKKEVIVQTWNHLVEGEGVVRDILSFLSNREFSSFFQRKGNVITFSPVQKGNFEKILHFMNELYHLYRHASFQRVVESGFPRRQKDRPRGKSILIVYPPFRQEAIVRAVSLGLKVPSGITRHIVHRRALGVDISLSLMRRKISLQEKNAILTRMISRRIHSGHVRVYEEPVVIYND